MAHVSLHLLAWCLAFLTFTQLLLLLLFSCPQLCQSALHTICPFKTLLLWSLSTVWTMVSITGTLNPFISYSHSTASNSHLFPLRMPWTSPFLCFSILVLYWSVTPICSPAAKFYITILEFCCTRHWEITSASALIFWTGIRPDKQNISFHSSLKNVWTPVSTDSTVAGSIPVIVKCLQSA